MTDDELLARLAETPVDEWSLAETDELRARLPHNPLLREALREYLLVETVLSSGLAKPNISAAQILARVDAQRRSRFGGRVGWWAALILLVPALSAAAWLWTMREPPPDEQAAVDPQKSPLWPTATASSTAPRPMPTVRPAPSPSATASATADTKPDAPPPPPVKPPEPEPWEAMLARAPRPAEELACDDRRLTHDETLLLRWWDVLKGQQRRVETREDRGIVLDGTFRLRAPWTADTLLTLWLRDTSFGRDDGTSRVRLYLWHGEQGVMLEHRRQPHERWAAYVCTKRRNEPEPETSRFAAADDELARRTGYGPLDLAYRGGRLYLSRGDVVLLTAPLAGMPDAVYLEGRTKLKAIGLARSGGVPDAWVPRPVPAWSDYTPETEVLTAAVDGAKVERLGPSDLLLTASVTKTEAWAALPVTRPGFHEAVVEIESADPGTGIYWGDATGKPKYAYAVVHEQRQEVPMLIYSERRELDPRYRHDPRGLSEPRVGFPLYLRLVAGLGSIRCYASSDGVSWGRLLDPFRNTSGTVGSIGIYAAAGSGSRSIRIRNVSFRTLLSYDDALAGELPPAPQEWTYAPWLLQALKGDETDEVRFHRLAKALTLGLPLELARRIVFELAAIPCGDLPPEAAKTVEADLDYVGRLAQIIDAWDASNAELWADRLARSPELVVDRSDVVERDPRIHAPFSTVRKAIVERTPPHSGRVVMLRPDLMRREIARLVLDADWDELERVCRAWHRFGGTDEMAELGVGWSSHVPTRAPIMELVDWAAATAERRRETTGDNGNRAAPRIAFRSEWRHPLVEHFGKEGYNVLAELETALEEKAYGDACRIISGVTAAQAIGLLPNAHDPDLLASLPGAVALAMKSNPDLRSAMQREYGELALLRLRQATADGDLAAVRAVTTQFFGTAAAAQAQLWLGDRALSQGDAARAEGHYQAAVREGSPDAADAIEPRLRLAAAWQGRDFGAPPPGSVRLGETVLSPTEFERVVSTLRGRAGAPSASSRVVAPSVEPQRAETWPAPTAYKLQKWADLDGDVGRGGDQPKQNLDYVAAQTSVAFLGERMIVHNRFQTAAYELKDGKRAWRTSLASEQGRTFQWPGVPFAPLLADGCIFVRRLAAAGPELACLAQSDGRVIWRTARGEIIASDPLLVGDQLLAVTQSVPQSDVLELSLTVYDARTGRTLRSRSIGQLRDYWKRELNCYLTAAEEMLVVSAGPCLIGCDAEGEPRWTRRLTYVPTKVDPRLGPELPQPPVVEADRIEVAQPGVPYRYVVDVRSGSIVEQRLEVRDEAPLPDAPTGPTTTVLAVDDGRTLELARERFGDKGTRSRMRWLRDGDELTHTWLAPWSQTLRGAGPAAAHGGRLWVFAADDVRSGVRRIMELVPDGPPRGDALPAAAPAPAAAWLTSTLSRSLEETQRFNPEWQLMSLRQIYIDERNFTSQKLFVEDDCVLTYVGRECPVFWVRQVALPAERDAALYVRVAAPQGDAWTLTVDVEQEKIFERKFEAGKSTAWVDERIDLAKFRGRTVRVALGSEPDAKKAAYIGWQRMEIR